MIKPLRLRIYDICRKFEWSKFAAENGSSYILIDVDQDRMSKYRFTIRMREATPFKDAKEAYRSVIFARNGLEENVMNLLEDMYAEIFDS